MEIEKEGQLLYLDVLHASSHHYMAQNINVLKPRDSYNYQRVLEYRGTFSTDNVGLD